MKPSVSALLVAALAGIRSSHASLPIIQVSENDELSPSERKPAHDIRKQNIYTRQHLVHNKEHSQVESPKSRGVSDDQQTATAVE